MDDKCSLDDFRGRFEESKVAEGLRRALIQDLIDQNGKLVKDCQRMSLDLDSEKNERRRLQNRIRDELEPLIVRLQGEVGEPLIDLSQNRRPFVLVLIDADGDGYIFRDIFVNMNEEGGRRAADVLLTQVHKYMGELELDPNNTDVVVRAYANLRGLSKHCVSKGLMKTTADLGLFANGFTKRQPLFDFVDVGLGKERADDKIRETFKFFIGNSQCKHVLLGIAHDSGYAASLEQFAASESVKNRVTLLEGFQVNPAVQALGFPKAVRFASVFGSGPGSRSPENNVEPSSAATIQTARSTTGPYTCPSVDGSRLGPIWKNDQGLRIDKPLAVDTSAMQALKKKNLCVWLFLRGYCKGCPRNHSHPPLSVGEQDALWLVARQGTCYTHSRGRLCDVAMCVYGHAPW